MEALILTAVNTHLLPAFDQHGFRPGHSTTSDLLQLTSDVATGFNQTKPPYRTICVAVDLTAAFDAVNHNVLPSKIVRSTLPEATCRWLSNYIRGRQSVTSCRGVKSKARIIYTGVLQGSKLSPTLFNFYMYIADMPRPTEPVRRICYANDITVWASGVKKIGTRAKCKYLFDGDVPVLMGKLAFDISTKVISNLIYAKPGACQYPPEDQDR